MDVVLLVGALLIGGLLAVQTSANLQLTRAVGTPYGASTVQLWIAAGLLAALAVAAGALGALGGVATVPAWYLLGGLASPLYITSAILLFPRMGALAAGGLFVTGQVLASVALDLFGLLGVPRQPVSAGMVVGSLAVLGGISLVVRGQRAAVAAQPVPVGAQSPARSAGGRSPLAPGWLLLGLVAGAVLPVQGAINARLRTALEEPIAVALVSFTVAAVAMSIALAVLVRAHRTPAPRRPTGLPWWGWSGGLCAAAYVTGTFLLIPLIGAAVTVALTVTGQQVASAAVDTRGWFRLPRRPLTAPRGAGLLLLVAGSALVLTG